MTDIELVFSVLKDQQPHHVLEIIQRCKPGAVNWAVRTRISNLKAKLIPGGYTIVSRKDPDDKMAIYQIVPIGKPVQLEFSERRTA